MGDPYGEFSNLALDPISLKEKAWPTSEHYFQAQKFAGTPHEEAIRKLKSPMAAAKEGRSRALPLRSDWDAGKDDIMREAVLARFQQHARLRVLLLATGDAEIVEHTANDSYWGDGGDGSGLNMLGRILMETRALLGRWPFNAWRNSRRSRASQSRRQPSWPSYPYFRLAGTMPARVPRQTFQPVPAAGRSVRRAACAPPRTGKLASWQSSYAHRALVAPAEAA